MHHVKPISKHSNPVDRALALGSILAIVGTVLSTIGGLLLSLSPFFDKGGS